MEYSENKIQRLLRSKYLSTSKYIIENIYFFKHNWESDMFILKTNGYVYEIEIKISISDFKADRKKDEKHNTLANGGLRPNKFFYCLPKEIADKVEIPKYAGLIVVTELGVFVKKEAPFLHKDKLEVDKKIANKMYSRWRTEVFNVRQLKEDIKILKRRLDSPNLFNQK